MPVNFPDSPSNGATFTSGGITFTYNSTGGTWSGSTAAAAGTFTDLTATSLDVSGAATFGSGTTRITTYSDSSYSGIFNGSSLTSDESIYMGADATFFYVKGSELARLDY